MDREKLRRQAAILRRKRMARTVNTHPQIQGKVLRLETPLPIPQTPKQIEMPSPNQSEIRRKQTDKTMEQTKIDVARKSASAKKNTSCGGCGRKKQHDKETSNKCIQPI